MRRLFPLACAAAVLVCMLALPAAASAADPPTGGASAPGDGTVTYGQPTKRAERFKRAQAARPVAREFSVAPAAVAPGSPVKFAYRVRGRTRKVRVRIVLRRGARVVRLRLGYRRTGVRHTYAWKPSALPAGDYAVALQAFDGAGRGLRRTAARAGPAPADHPGAAPAAGRAAAVRDRRLPGRGRVLVRRAGRALRRGPARPHPPGPGRHRRAGHAARRAGGGDRLLDRLPGERRRPLRRRARGRRASTTSSCTS